MNIWLCLVSGWAGFISLAGIRSASNAGELLSASTMSSYSITTRLNKSCRNTTQSSKAAHTIAPFSTRPICCGCFLLEKFGGIWADTSVYPLATADEIIKATTTTNSVFFYSFSGKRVSAQKGDRLIANWFMIATEPNQYAIQALTSEYKNRFLPQSDGATSKCTRPIAT